MSRLCVKTYDQLVHKSSMPAASVRLAFLTDYHNGSPALADEILLRLSQISPDMICIGGDMLVGKPDTSTAPALEFVKRVSEAYPVVYAYGNHEYRMCLYPETYGDAGQRYEEALLRMPLTLLRNSSDSFAVKELSFSFTGLEIPAVNYKKWKKIPFSADDVQHLVGKPNKENIQVLLAHNPVYSDVYLDWGADIILCGHMHGGIVRLFGRPVIGTDGRFFPRYGYGRIDRADASVYVSAGLGEHTIPIRLFNPREIVVVNVTNEI